MALSLTTSCELGNRAVQELKDSIASAYGLSDVAIRLTVDAPALETVKAPEGGKP